jgi:hypothetical protein
MQILPSHNVTLSNYYVKTNKSQYKEKRLLICSISYFGQLRVDAIGKLSLLLVAGVISIGNYPLANHTQR